MLPYATDAQRRSDLRRMKAFATGLLLIAVAVYAVSYHFEHSGSPGWVGYVRAAAEAAMVGALADWFAVTALFRHPLGLPIPHTALIKTRKEALGRSLEGFVATNFLSEQIVRDKVAAVGVSSRVGTWLSDEGHAQRVTQELANLARGAVAVLRDDAVQSVLEQTLVRRVVDRPWGPPAGQLLGEIVRKGTHHRLVDVGIDEIYGWLLDNRDGIISMVTDQAPAWSPRFLDERVANRVYSELTKFVREVKTDPEHRLRLALDNFLLSFAQDLCSDPYTIDRVERLKERVLAHPEVRHSLSVMWTTARKLILDAIEDESSELRRRVRDGLVGLGRRLCNDESLRARVDGWVETALCHAVTNYRDEIVNVISETVNRWDAEEASRKIELQVGRDLQFIRINGTVVGALAGLLIHALTVLAL